MKLSQNEKAGINAIEIMNAKLDGSITLIESMFYIIIRDHAFPSKEKGERGISMMQVHQLEERLHYRYTKKRIRTILGSLVKAGLLQANYYVKTKEGHIPYTDIKDFDGENGLGRKRIAYTKYSVLQAPTEKKARKDLIKKRKKK